VGGGREEEVRREDVGYGGKGRGGREWEEGGVIGGDDRKGKRRKEKAGCKREKRGGGKWVWRAKRRRGNA